MGTGRELFEIRRQDGDGDVRNPILDMYEADKDNTRDGVSRKIMSDSYRREPNYRLMYEISQNLDDASKELLQKIREEAFEEGFNKGLEEARQEEIVITHAKCVLSISSNFGLPIDEVIQKLNIEPSLIPRVKKKIEEIHK